MPGKSDQQFSSSSSDKVGAALVSNSTDIAPHPVAETLPQVIVVPVNPLSRVMTSDPVMGVTYPRSAVGELLRVQPVAAVTPPGSLELPTKEIVGFPVKHALPKAGAGVVELILLTCVAV
jgi:hypothetical protein